VNGDPRAVDGILRVMERRARLLGLDAPQRVAVGPPAAADVIDEETLRS
jgi:hypothetical protein